VFGFLSGSSYKPERKLLKELRIQSNSKISFPTMLMISTFGKE
jgi:hypothetical protein